MSVVGDLIRSELMSVAELCKLYGISRRTYEKIIKADPPPHITKGRNRLFVRSELLEWRAPRKRR